MSPILPTGVTGIGCSPIPLFLPASFPHRPSQTPEVIEEAVHGLFPAGAEDGILFED